MPGAVSRWYRTRRTGWLLPVFGLSTLWTAVASGQSDEEGLSLKSDSQAPYVHRLTLYDHDEKAIDPNDPLAGPYSPRATCAKCHAYNAIASGWHFNAPRDDVPPGRPGEPWFLVDPQTRTMLPISGRRWPGTFAPADAELTNWQFVKRFGHHLPGGSFGEPGELEIENAPEARRWTISGPLEIDCMFCHSADQQHDPAEAARQLEAENFKWAPTVALGLAAVRGAARKAPDDWDPAAPPNPDFPERSGPKLVWNKSRFDADNRVFFNITRRIPNERCYFCHSFREVGPDKPDDLVASRDVHLAAGLLCVDCHRNQIDHMIARGYDREAHEREEPALAAFSCAGCHLGTDAAPVAADGLSPVDPTVRLGGRYTAPHPQHRGLPPVHFEKLTCTACHSGPWPEMDAHRFQTALAHGLGVATRDRSGDTWPLIVEPVFALQPDGKIAPQRLVWPAFWARREDNSVHPLLPEVIVKAAGKILPRHDPHRVGPLPPLTDEQLAQVPEALAAQKGATGETIYVRDGRAYRRTPDGRIEAVVLPATGPCRWSIAHDVRPAAQSLGVRGCTDCHAADAPIYFGRVAAADDAQADTRPLRLMHELRPDDVRLARAWALGFPGRTAFKAFGLTCAAIVTLILLSALLDGFLGVPGVRRGLTRPEGVAYAIMLLAAANQAVTGFGHKLGFGELQGWRLLIHLLGAPLFIVGLTAVAVLRARRCRFGRAGSPPAGLTLAQRLMFWVLVVVGLVIMTTMLAAMLPIFGYAEQETLRQMHETAALCFLIAVLLHGGASYAARRRQRELKT